MGIVDRLQRLVTLADADIESISYRLHSHFYGSAPPDIRQLSTVLADEPLLAPVYAAGGVRCILLDNPVMTPPPPGIPALNIPHLPTLRDLSLWLCVDARELAWFADSRYRQNKIKEEKLHHYRYIWLPKRSGGQRFIETPKARLKEMQRRVLKDILNHVPPHDAAHGFTRARSIKSNAAAHLRQETVLRLDLKDFFHSVPVPRISAMFRSLGYPQNVAYALQGICTNSISPPLAGAPFKRLSWHEQKRLQAKHLPQGAPTSSALANLCAWGLDCRLEALASRYGFHYTRYADDLAFSGDSSLARCAGFIEMLTGAIAIEEGFMINHHKTRLRRSSQRQKLAGVIVNERVNLQRTDWDRLKATLHNCAKFGPESQNRDGHLDFKAHLEGRVAHANWLNPARGEKLRLLLKKISW